MEKKRKETKRNEKKRTKKKRKESKENKRKQKLTYKYYDYQFFDFFFWGYCMLWPNIPKMQFRDIACYGGPVEKCSFGIPASSAHPFFFFLLAFVFRFE